MAEEIRPQKIGDPEGLLFRFSLESGPAERQVLAWGRCEVFVASAPVWYASSEDEETLPVTWTWIDLLDFLGLHWPWLENEQTYPLVVPPPANPLTFRTSLERAWQEAPEERVLEEDEQAFLFEERHDLSRGMLGIFLPALYVMREGMQCWICSEESGAVQRPFAEVRATLTAVGDFIAAHVAPHVQAGAAPRAAEALANWESRRQRTEARKIELLSGMPLKEMASLHGDALAAEFFECGPEDEDTELLAAARLSAGVVSVAVQRSFLELIRKLRKTDTPGLDVLAEKALEEVTLEGKPHEQGYALANWLRKKLDIAPDAKVDPDTLLQEWNVVIQEVDEPSAPLIALAAWGRKHGPGIFLNTGAGTVASHSHGRRTTMAHEICHLLLDRRSTLPAAEVLGGRAPLQAEQRARAFAAEFLLPRDTVYRGVDPVHDLEQAIDALSSRFEVSRQLVATQLRNSDRYVELDYNQRTIVTNISRTFHSDELF